ncbi:TVP38/TMEM64 family protein [Gracilibacillus alcaliphilus]|uniref:TVP38/TMEM64 family protein n=1 Tax=Gracilibacillus alcaliphilus TaxID=1401441 RepID=UPI00195B26F2|nr:TVP38/TMEM64 family protein [Gracilibacillus alcaliphilus]MBM7675424.1 putative membrane protein YdjX (TVP38/TMEM64 family) [Gracilibacillus alcaliphilus]
MILYSINNIEHIDVDEMKDLFEANEYGQLVDILLQSYESLGPLPGFLLPFIEAFLPFLPIIAFVITNAAAYGLLEGFLLSLSGTSAGTILVFILVRRYQHWKVFRWLTANKQVSKVTNWFTRHGFGPLFLLLCFPFSPSAIINVVAALSNVKFYQFVLAVLLGKGVMVFTISFVGDSLVSFAQNPIRTVLVAIGVVILWMLGKYIENYLHSRSEGKKQI